MALGITLNDLKQAIAIAGLTGPKSADLQALLASVEHYYRFPVGHGDKERRVKDAFLAWRNGNHPGELALLANTPAFQTLANHLASVTPSASPPPLPARPLNTPASGLASVLVSLLSEPNNNFNFKRTTDQRLRLLRDALEACQSDLNAHIASIQTDNAFQAIFLAPEYFFTKENISGGRVPLEETDRALLVAKFAELSRAFPSILIVPGTVFYAVSMGPEQKRDAGFELLRAAKERVERERAQAKDKAAFQPKDVLGYVMSQEHSGPKSGTPSMNALADALLDPHSAPRRAHNAAYLFLNGRLWARYDKHADFFECKSASPDNMMFVPGTQDQCPEIGDATRKFRFGAEICFDHGKGILKRRNPANLHFHLCVSDAVMPVTGNMAMTAGGWFLHASTYHQVAGVYRYEPGQGIQNQTAARRVTQRCTGQTVLESFLLPLPLPLAPPLPPRD